MEPQATDTQLQVIVGKEERTLNRQQLIKFQLLAYCHFMGYLVGKDPISNRDMDCMTLLGMQGTIDLNLLCVQSVEYGIFKSTNSARNALDQMCVRNLVIKKEKDRQLRTKSSRKNITLHPDIGVQSRGNVKLQYIMYSPDEGAL